MSGVEALAQVVLLGAVTGGVYALMASGLSLTFGVMRVVNISHAVTVLAAAYMAFVLYGKAAIDPLIGAPVLAAAWFVLGLGLYRLCVRPFWGSSQYSLLTVLSTFALALVVEGILAYTFRGEPKLVRVPYGTEAFLLGRLFVPKAQAFAALLSVAGLGALFALLYGTRPGRAIRATMQNRRAAQTVGVDVDAASALAFALGTSLAGVAGAMLGTLYALTPGMHWRFIALLLSTVALGGMGSLAGTIVGAVLLGIVSSLMANYGGTQWSVMVFYLALLLILLFKPEGLFGEKSEWA